mmetsp:Transcript_15124/g.38385  ORF Transcript_15124/g.38385 Transcript_15124/m.38385 type:complete len:201 (-) Transcript_15124:74-676(-)
MHTALEARSSSCRLRSRSFSASFFMSTTPRRPATFSAIESKGPKLELECTDNAASVAEATTDTVLTPCISERARCASARAASRFNFPGDGRGPLWRRDPLDCGHSLPNWASFSERNMSDSASCFGSIVSVCCTSEEVLKMVHATCPCALRSDTEVSPTSTCTSSMAGLGHSFSGWCSSCLTSLAELDFGILVQTRAKVLL